MTLNAYGVRLSERRSSCRHARLRSKQKPQYDAPDDDAADNEKGNCEWSLAHVGSSRVFVGLRKYLGLTRDPTCANGTRNKRLPATRGQKMVKIEHRSQTSQALHSQKWNRGQIVSFKYIQHSPLELDKVNLTRRRGPRRVLFAKTHAGRPPSARLRVTASSPREKPRDFNAILTQLGPGFGSMRAGPADAAGAALLLRKWCLTCCAACGR